MIGHLYDLAAANQSSMYPAGRQAHLIQALLWLFIIVTGTVYVLTMLFVLLVGKRSRAVAPAADAPTLSDPPRESRLGTIISICVGITIVILFALLISDYLTGSKYHANDVVPDIYIKVTGRQWWWDVEYRDLMNPSNSLHTANEICLPVGKTARIDLEGADVIHSFWVPNLAGKKDAIPLHPTAMWLRADRPGKYEGQCAEFCGLGHAKMRMMVSVVFQDEYNKWYTNVQAEAPKPQTDLQKKGQQIFLSSTCVMCHTISGTTAMASFAPGLSHLGSRQAIAAGTLKNTPENLSKWILDPPSIKPGTRMPQHNIAPQDLNALVAYLESLK
jgi:cytochrome c oxidase subunit 2